MRALIILSADDPHACSLAGVKTEKLEKRAGILIVDAPTKGLAAVFFSVECGEA